MIYYMVLDILTINIWETTHEHKELTMMNKQMSDTKPVSKNPLGRKLSPNDGLFQNLVVEEKPSTSIMNNIQGLENMDKASLLDMTTKVITAYLSNNSVETGKVPDLIDSVYKCLEELSVVEPNANTQSGQIPIKKTVQPDYIICLEDGKKLKMLKRHLRTNFHMSPEEYRAKWGLPSDYPMVAPNYAARRSAFAKKIGLGKSGARA